MSFLMPKMPSPPAMVMPEVKDVPNYDDEERKKEQRTALEASETVFSNVRAPLVGKSDASS